LRRVVFLDLTKCAYKQKGGDHMASAKVDGEKLKNLREDALLSQKELAEASGVSEYTITRLEGGEPSYGRTIKSIAKALDVNFRELLPGKALAR
jgi:transcriptional regulator with XRE-family HTH domain